MSDAIFMIGFCSTSDEFLFVSSHTKRLTNRWSQPLAVVMTRFNFMKQFPVFAILALASGGSAPSR
jgi:hypothetical protein